MAAADKALSARLTELLQPVVEDHGLELADLQFRREPAGWVLRLVIDGDDGVTLDDCTRISREVSHLLEVEDPIEQAFNLEVSSPGLDRPLKREQDYRRCRGRKAKLVCREPIAGEPVVIGEIGEMAEQVVTIITEAGPVAVPLAQVKRARLVIEW